MGQAVLLNALLRNYLHYNLVDQAQTLSVRAAFPENASNNQFCRCVLRAYFIIIIIIMTVILSLVLLFVTARTVLLAIVLTLVFDLICSYMKPYDKICRELKFILPLNP